MLVIATDVLIAWIISPVITSHVPYSQVSHLVIVLAAVALFRALTMFAREAGAQRAANRIIVQLRGAVAAKATRLGPRWQARKAADTTTLLARGLEDLGPYFTAYLPQLILSCTVTPLTLAVMLWLDWLSAIVAVITIPLIPIFMILIGRLTEEASNRRLAAMQQLGRQLLDLISGLPTLKALGREQGPRKEIRKIGDTYARTTMKTLTVAFMSGGVLEFIATLSVALVAVETGFRLVYGNIELAPALAVIMLAPEVYAPLREVGKQFHASANGVAAANAAFEILETPEPPRGNTPCPPLQGAHLRVHDLKVAARGMWAPDGLTFSAKPGEITALVGKSGGGKTTTIMAVLGLGQIDHGSVEIVAADGRATNLKDIDPTTWWSNLAWVPQSPVILPGTILENIFPDPQVAGQLLPGGKESAELTAALDATGFREVIDNYGWDHRIGQGGRGLSVGQRQRLALTRALLGDQQIIVMDEPTAHLDARLEAQVGAAVSKLRDWGRIVLVIAHRAPLKNLADNVVHVRATPMSREETRQYGTNDGETTGDATPLEDYEFLDERALSDPLIGGGKQ